MRSFAPWRVGESLRAFWLVLAAVPLVAAAAATATAQSPPPPPRQSTRLTVDFDRPDEAPAPDAAKPAVPERVAPPAVADHLCTTGDAGVDAVVREAGATYGLDPCLIVAVMAAESGYRRYAVSPKGACGYMQLMPDTARRFGVSDLFDARQNIHAGARYLRFLLDRFGGSLELALAGYNAGEGAVERYGNRIPPFLETQNYVRTISGRYMSRRAAQTTFRPEGGDVAPPLPSRAVAAGPSRPAVVWRMSVSFEPK